MNSINAATGLSPAQTLRMRQQAEEFEGVFLTMLTKEMFAGIKPDKNFGGGFGEETWRGMQAEQFANSMAQNGGIGIADQILSQMLSVQEASQTNNIPVNGAYR